MEKVIFLFIISSTFALSLRNNTTRSHHRVPPHGLNPIKKLATTTNDPPSLPTESTLCNIKIFRQLRLPWMDAFRACKAIGNGTELVSLESEKDFALVAVSLRETNSPLPVIYWTSGVDLVEEGVYTWMSNGKPLENVTFWSSGQPDNLWDSEHCLGLRRRVFDRDYKLTDENCHLAGAFVCAQRCI